MLKWGCKRSAFIEILRNVLCHENLCVKKLPGLLLFFRLWIIISFEQTEINLCHFLSLTTSVWVIFWTINATFHQKNLVEVRWGCNLKNWYFNEYWKTWHLCIFHGITIKLNFLISLFSLHIRTTYVRDYLWCTSKLSFQARFPEISDQILQNTSVLEFGSITAPPPLKWNSCQIPSPNLPRTPPPIENFNFLSRVQNWPYPEHPPPWKLKTLIFFPESKTDLTQNHPPLPKKIENSDFLSRVQNWPYPEHPFLKIENSNFLSRVQNWPYPLPENWKLIFFPESKSDLSQNTPLWQLKYVKTNGYIPQGYHLVFLVESKE